MLNHLYTLIFFLGVCSAYGQCPQFFDNSGNLSSQPVWKFCDDAASTLNIQSDQNLGNYTVNWGDGNTSNGNSLPAGQILSHNYAAGIQTYTVTITTGGCTIEGTYIKELPVKASIEVPPNGVTQVCAPGSMDFLNNSTGNSPNTTYFWDFGDGQTLGPLGSGNAGQTVTHTYQAGTVDCDTRVTLIAENECSTRPSEATFEPVQIWDIDKPGLGANPTLLCWPDNTVTYTNNTDRNCSRPEEGNTFQRYERWIFHDFFGPGQDSIIDWRPWPPSPPRTVSYPGPGTYDVTLQVRNFCGDAEITRSITIIDEPEALFSLDKDTVCAGQEVTLTKLTGAPANRFRFTTGEGGWSNFGNQNSRTFSYTSPGNYTVGFAIDVNNGTPACKDTAYLPIVVLDDPTADFSISANEGCESLSVSITNQSQDAISWVWDYGNGFTFTGQNPPDVLYNQPGTYTLSLTCTNAKGCTSTFSREINVYSNPEPDFNDGAACLGQEYVFNGEANADPNDPVTSWTWDFGDGIDGNGQNVNHIYFQDGPKIVTLEVETENCSASISKTIDIESLPVASYTPDPSVGCAPVDINFFNTSSGANKFYWDFDDGEIDSVNANPVHNFVNSSGSEVIRQVQLVAVNNFGCTDTFSRDITIRPEINAAFDQLITDNCSFVEVQFRNLTPNGSVFEWDFGDGGTSNQENPLHQYVNNGQFTNTYTVVLTVTNPQGCSDTVSTQINIKPAAIFDFSGVPDEACTPAEIIFQAESGAVSYEWDFGDGSTANGQFALKTFVNNSQNTRVYRVRLTAVTSEGCTDVVEQDITIHPKPRANFTRSDTASCSPFDLTLTNTSTGADNFIWRYGDGFSSGNAQPSHNYQYTNTGSGNRVFDIELEVISNEGCRDTVKKSITVFPGIEAQMSGIDEGCDPLVLNLSGNGGDSYNWDFDNGMSSSQQNETVTFRHDGGNGPTEFVVELEAVSNNACNAYIRDTVRVFPNPVAAFTQNKTSGCTPLEVGFIPQSSGTNTYYWQFEPGAGEQNTGSSVSYEYVNIGSSPVSRTPRLIIENEFSCRDTTFGQVTIFPPVRAQAAFSDTGCAPFFVNFFNVSSGANSYLWDFGAFGSSALASPKILFDVDDSVYRNFPFSLIASSSFGCRDTFVDDVTIHPTPQASFTRSPAAGCQPLNVSFSNTSRGASSFIWDYGLGERDSLDQLSFQKEFSNETLGIQNRPLQLVAVNTYGCRDTVGASLQVFPKIEAKFDSVPSGCSPHVITVVNESVGESILNWSFSSGDADNGNSVARQFDNTTPNDQNHWVELIATNGQGCKDTLRRDFVVYGNPIAQFNADPTFQKFPSSTVNFTNTTAGLNWTYEWDFGDTSAIVNTRDASNTYDYWGTYRVRLKAFSSQCSDSAFINVVIDPPAPVADFIGGGEGCRPLTLSFADLSQFANNYFWDFGDGGSTNTPNPTYTFYNPGVYTVSLVVTGPDGSSSRHEIPQAVEVYENASAFFTSSPSTVFADEDPVDFVNLSTGADFYTWDFGDGNKSTEESPSHFYSAPGTYDVQLIADNEFGCADTFVVNNSIRVVVGGFIDVPNAFSPSPSGPTGGFYDPNSLNNDVFFAFNKDVIQFKMEIFTRWGEKIFESRDVNIGWDGYSDGTLCQQDVYVYKIVATFEDGQTFEQIGDVTLLR